VVLVHKEAAAMLCISRKLDEAVRVGEDVEIVVLAIEGRKVKLGIIAPAEVRVLRAELDDDGRTAGVKTRSKV
jgi:carbon storage regulator CsrA